MTGKRTAGPGCPLCGRRPIANAVPVRRLLRREPPERLLRETHVVLGCLPCLRRELLRANRSAFAALGPLFRVSLLLEAPALVLRNLGWWLAIGMLGPTAWLRGALEEAGLDPRAFLGGAAGGHPLDLAERISLARAQLCLMQDLAAADGSISEREAAALRSFLRYFWSAEPEVFDAIDAEATYPRVPRPADSDAACATIRRLLSAGDHRLFLYMLLGIAEQTGGVVRPELQRIQALSVACGIDPQTVRSAIEGYLPHEAAAPGWSGRASAERASAWQILGVARGASRKEIRSAYLRLARENHPDRFTHLGPAMEAEANRRMKRINAAYCELYG